MPDRISGGGLVNDRLVLYPFFALILWLGTTAHRPFERRIIQTIATALTLILLGWRTISYARMNDYLSEYLSARPHLAQGATLASIPFSDRIYAPDGHFVSSRIFPIDHASGFLAADRGLVDLTGNTD